MPPVAIQWTLTDEGLRTAVFTAAKKISYSIDRPGMYRRDLADSLDHKIMGDAAATSVAHYISSSGGNALIYDFIREDDFKKPDPGWDVLISNQEIPQTQIPEILQGRFGGATTISVKSSRLPSKDTIESAIGIRDFKIFKKPNEHNIEDSLTTMIEAQVYYNYTETLYANLELDDSIETPLRAAISEIDRSLKKSECAHAIDFIMDLLNVRNRWGDCYLAAYDTFDNMVSYSASLPVQERAWESFGKQMWIAPLRRGESFPNILNV